MRGQTLYHKREDDWGNDLEQVVMQNVHDARFSTLWPMARSLLARCSSWHQKIGNGEVSIEGIFST